MLTNLHKTPWPWFGGKSDAAPLVWQALGDVAHYVEPFAGSLAVLLRRPHEANRTYYSETVNDLDGLLVNAWRAMQHDPDGMAEAASWPVSEADLHARHLALLRWREERNLELLMADPEWHDAKMAGWWAWGQSCWIGGGWCSGRGAWVVGADGRITKRSKSGRGVGQQLPHLSSDGRGVNRPQAREPGVGRQLPHLSSDGQGVNHCGAREHGVGDYHPMTMPELTRWFRFLSARLRHVRILCGDWKRACTSGVVRTLPVRMKADGFAGMFLDPPYVVSGSRESDIYTHDDGDSVSAAVLEYCLAHTHDDVRIVLAGYDGDYPGLLNAGWREVEWFRGGFLKGGMGNVGGSGNHQQNRERLYLSPACLPVEGEEAARRQVGLFGGDR